MTGWRERLGRSVDGRRSVAGVRDGAEERCCGYSPEEKFATAETAAAAESWLRPSPARRGGVGEGGTGAGGREGGG